MAGFAVVDCETTGLDATNDRMCEIGVVLLKADGAIEGTWHTLVNPHRPMGASFIHGLHDEDVADAPDFGDIAPELIELLYARVFVAHHVRFDAAFLNAAFARCGIEYAIEDAVCVCTMDLSRIYLPDGSHSLPAVAQRAGLRPSAHHRALADALVAAQLLRFYMACESEGRRYAECAYSREGCKIRPATWISALHAAHGQIIRGNREELANARDGAISTSSWIQSGESARA